MILRWVAIAITVVLHDVWTAGRGNEMLSEAVDRWLVTDPQS
jgi:hypothetical protein